MDINCDAITFNFRHLECIHVEYLGSCGLLTVEKWSYREKVGRQQNITIGVIKFADSVEPKINQTIRRYEEQKFLYIKSHFPFFLEIPHSVVSLSFTVLRLYIRRDFRANQASAVPSRRNFTAIHEPYILRLRLCSRERSRRNDKYWTD